MRLADVAEQILKGGDPVAALSQLQEQVRARPSDPKLRIFLFQLLCVLGQWERALNQLTVAAELEPEALAMRQIYGSAVHCEAARAEVFDGKRSPMIFGQPDQWLALLIESLLVGGRGERGKSEELRLRAFEDAPASAGSVDERPFTDLRRGCAPGVGARSHHQRPLLGAVRPSHEDSD
jgi:type VI secretion system protein ImpE